MPLRVTARDLRSRPLSVTVLGVVVIAVAFAIRWPRETSLMAADGRGIGLCSSRAEADLLPWDALQCWFQAGQGRWRTLSSASANGALVVEAEAADILDPAEIAQRFVSAGREQFVEILVYVQHEPPAGARLPVTRIRWTRQDGFETLGFGDDSIP